MIHRALLGSFERFIGILIEHYAGELPLWLAPVQASCCPSPTASTATERGAGAHAEAACAASWTIAGESVGRKVRDAELRRIPLMLVVGEREEQESTAAVRERRVGGAHAKGRVESTPARGGGAAPRSAGPPA